MTNSIGCETKICPKIAFQGHCDEYFRSSLNNINDDLDRLIKNKKIRSIEIKSKLSDLAKKTNQLYSLSGGQLPGAMGDRLHKMEQQISSLSAIHGSFGSGNSNQLPDLIRASGLSDRYCIQSNALFRESARQLGLASLDLLAIIAYVIFSTYYAAMDSLTRSRIERLEKEIKISIASSGPDIVFEKDLGANTNYLSQKQRLRDFNDKLGKITDRLMHLKDIRLLRVQGQRVLFSKVVNLANLKHLKNLEKKQQVARSEPVTRGKGRILQCQKWSERVNRQTLIQSDSIKKHDERVKKYHKLIARFETTKRVSRRIYDTIMALRERNGSFQRS